MYVHAGGGRIIIKHASIENTFMFSMDANLHEIAVLTVLDRNTQNVRSWYLREFISLICHDHYIRAHTLMKSY